ncbi:MAG: hypothetical protein IJS61_00150 [Firmicutes bacterium]|nr:hypothetical protein [Bacillota bacterium]
MNKNIIIKKEQASYSLETAIVMIVVFTVVIFLTFMTYVMYEQVRLNAIAQDTAERGGMIYAVKDKEMYTGRIGSEEFNAQNPYWRIYDANGKDRIDKIRTYAIEKLNKYKIEKEEYSSSAVSVKPINYFVYKRIIVDINVEYNVPFGGILNIFMKSKYPIHAHAEANVSEPAEFVRTIDLGRDIIDAFLGAEKVEKYRGAIQKALNWINKQ